MPISFSRREQSAMHIPKEWSLHLAPDRLWKFRGRAGAAHPVWKVPEQGWKLTLGLERNLTCENPDAHGAKWHAITLTLCSKEWDTPHSSPPSQEEQPQTKKPTAWCFRGEGRQLKFHCPEQLEHPAEVHDFVTCGVAGRTPHCFLPGTASLLFTETWTPVWTKCNHVPHTCMPGSTGHVQILPEKTTDHDLRSWACCPLAQTLLLPYQHIEFQSPKKKWTLELYHWNMHMYSKAPSCSNNPT